MNGSEKKNLRKIKIQSERKKKEKITVEVMGGKAYEGYGSLDPAKMFYKNTTQLTV